MIYDLYRAVHTDHPKRKPLLKDKAALCKFLQSCHRQSELLTEPASGSELMYGFRCWVYSLEYVKSNSCIRDCGGECFSG